MGDGANTEHIWRRGSRLIWRSLRAYPWLHTTAMVGALGFVAASIGGAWVLRAATDDLVIPAFDDGTVDRSDVWVVMGLIVVVSVGRGIGVMMRRWYLSLAENSTKRDWRRALVNHYLDVPLRFHRERPTGELLAHADIDLTTATMVLKPLAFSVSVLALVIVAVVTLFIIHPLVALLGIVLFPLLVVMSQIYTSRVEAPSARAQQAVGEVASVAHESFEGALVVKTLGREAAEVEGCAASATLEGTPGRWSDPSGVRAEHRCPAQHRCGFVAAHRQLAGAARRRHPWRPRPGRCRVRPARYAASGLRLLSRGDAALCRCAGSRRQGDGPAGRATRGTATVPAGPVDVAVHGLVVGYGEHHVLQGVDLEVAAGTTAAVVGATGSGKSTLLEAVAGVLDRIEGTVAIGGVTSMTLPPTTGPLPLRSPSRSRSSSPTPSSRMSPSELSASRRSIARWRSPGPMGSWPISPMPR